MSDKPIVLSLCDLSGIMVEPWADAGFDCWCVDVEHDEGTRRVGPNRVTVGADVRTWIPPIGRYAMVFAFPPCTHLAGSGARWFKDKGLRALIDGLELVERCRSICEWAGVPWMLENPVGTLGTYWRPPDLTFHPYEFGGYVEGGDAYKKRTCLWVGDGFVMPEPRPVTPVEGSKMVNLPNNVGRRRARAMTPPGFARAVFEANIGPATLRTGHHVTGCN